VADSRIDELRRRLERDPGSRLFAQLAEEHRKAGNHAEAIRIARAGLAIHPSYASARLTLGRALLDSGDAGAARAELETALRQAPDNILASRFLGQALDTLGELGPALQQLQRTLKMAPGDRHLESQIASLQSRLRAPGAGVPPGGSSDVTGPMARPSGPPPGARETEDASVPATIPILLPAARAGWARGIPPPPPLPAPAAGARPRVEIEDLVGEPGLHDATPPPRSAAEGPGAEVVPPATAPPDGSPRRAVFAEPSYESDLAPTLPRTTQGELERVEGSPATAPPRGPDAPGLPGTTENAAAPFSSSTLAELYLRQGLLDRAVDVYRQLVAQEPGNARGRARLAELERAAAPDAERVARRRALERTIARLEELLAAVRRRRA
jgi:tetratricopeptide (TPR) repeat protein